MCLWQINKLELELELELCALVLVCVCMLSVTTGSPSNGVPYKGIK